MAKTILPPFGVCAAERVADGQGARCPTFTDGAHRCCLGRPHADTSVANAHRCPCGTGWFDTVELTAEPLVREVAVISARPGDLLVFDVDTDALSDRARSILEAHIEDKAGNGVRAVVLEHGRVVGLVRTEESWHEEIGENARCGREWPIGPDDLPMSPRHPGHRCRLLAIHPDVGNPGCQCRCGNWAPFPVPVPDVEGGEGGSGDGAG